MKEIAEEVDVNQRESIFHPNRFKEGEIVYERTHPSQKLIISHFADNLYYCKVSEAPLRKPLVYFERDLVVDTSYPSGD